MKANILLVLILPAIFFSAFDGHRLDAQLSPQTRIRTITLEEPTGIYRRDAEVVTVRLDLPRGEISDSGNLRVFSSDGAEVRTQVLILSKHPDGSINGAELLFPATIVPGERPVYYLVTGKTESGEPEHANPMVARRLGAGRVELANDRFGAIINLGLEGTEPAIVEAYNKSAADLKMLNLVDTTPDHQEPLKYGRRSAGIGTFLARAGAAVPRAGAFDQVEVVESGPWRSKVRLSGAGFGGTRETWEFTYTAGSPVLRWKTMPGETPSQAVQGFFFSSISASPYEPFDRWMEGIELRFPDGWETDNPPDHQIGGRDFDDLPGWHAVYYQRKENYGALGIIELDRSLNWTGFGARQFIATSSKQSGPLEIGISFPNWKGTETVLEARKEYRKFTQPILSVVREFDGPLPFTRGASHADRRTTVLPVERLTDPAPGRRMDISLDGEWKLRDAEKSEGEKLGYFREDLDDSTWRTVSVPGSVHTQVLPAGVYHTKEADWVSAKEWWYRRNFQAPAVTQGRRLWLKFDATDYHADIYLNGKLLGRHEGYIDPYQFEVTDLLRKDGPNSLAVRVWTPVSYYWRHRPYTIKGSYGAVDQKPDNITALGITRSVHLLATGPIRLDEVAVDTTINKDGSADVSVELTPDGSSARSNVRLTLKPRNFEGGNGYEIVSPLSAGQEGSKFVFHIEKPELWWTWDHGKPNLYTLNVAISTDGEVSDSRSLAVGIRTIEHVDWKFYLNGRRMYIRGTNSYYNLFMSEMRRADYDRDIGLMRKMNVNMIRLHCHFSNPEFYDVCDEQGILIWQDYLEAWYPEDRAFSLKAAQLYDPLIRYVRNHPSVALWATSDEESLENYRDLTKHLEPRLYLHDPQRRPVQRSTGRYGDAHVYEGWYGGTIWEYTKVREKFISELGATALPNYESLIKFLPNHWPIRDHQEDWVFHKLQIFEAMRAWGDPGEMSLREYIPQTQSYVARLFQLAIERMRRLKYQPAGGILHFHAIDIWPSVTMAALDYYRQPTKSFFTVQRSFQMVLPSFAYDRDTWRTGEEMKTELWIINDHWYAIPEASVTWSLEDSSGRIVDQGERPYRLTVDADSSKKLADLTVRLKAPGKFILKAVVRDGKGGKISENEVELTVK
ncbi:MAG: glycoside hydrolase family 2 protein [Blastocatellales bacterium]